MFFFLPTQVAKAARQCPLFLTFSQIFLFLRNGQNVAKKKPFDFLYNWEKEPRGLQTNQHSSERYQCSPDTTVRNREVGRYNPKQRRTFTNDIWMHKLDQ